MTKEKKYKWHKIAESETEIQNNGLVIIPLELKGKKICLTKFQDKWYAFAGLCPHAGGLFAEGDMDLHGNVVCPLHRYKFSVKNGRNTSGEGYALKTYPVEIRPDGIFLGIEDNGFMNWLWDQ